MRATNKQLQDKLNMANKTVAELMKEVETLKKDRDNFERNFNNVNECYEGIYDSYEKLKSDYAELQENYNKLCKECRNINAENVALKAEIERTNRHINLAENVIHEAKEQQPTVINHYHNCTINK